MVHNEVFIVLDKVLITNVDRVMVMVVEHVDYVDFISVVSSSINDVVVRVDLLNFKQHSFTVVILEITIRTEEKVEKEHVVIVVETEEKVVKAV